MVWVGGWIVAVFVLLGGCTRTQQVEAPDGNSGHLVSCSDTADCYEEARTTCDDAAALSPRLEKVLKLLTERYGKPTKREVTYPQSCAGAALPECLEQDRARFLYQWSFKGKKAITLLLGPKKVREAYEDPPKRTEADVTALKSIRVRYDEGRTPDPAKGASAAEATPESEREVGGL